ncbi:hypothetical protein [Oryzifoliimicrobium ureilyticus]|uniref:hypothetical protein n=1 Tax=Oryzifoliimicrobium ureilyticus TaxID=3113724 RepID=UPI003076246B
MTHNDKAEDLPSQTEDSSTSAVAASSDFKPTPGATHELKYLPVNPVKEQIDPRDFACDLLASDKIILDYLGR